MTAPTDPPAPLRRAALWALWAGSLALLTYGLVSPEPPKVGGKLFRHDVHYWVSNAVHLAGYAYLSALAGFLALGPRGELGLRLALVAHGALTEYLQSRVEGRYGSAEDAAIDAAGVILGWASVRLWRRLRQPARSPSPPAPP